MDTEWSNETVLNDSRDYFDHLVRNIEEAKVSIDLEVYIFEDSKIARKILSLFKKKAESGVFIRLLVDGIGSIDALDLLAGFTTLDSFEVRVYHPVPRPLSRWSSESSHFLELFSTLNKRDHKKMLIVDRQKAIVGSHNITDKSLEWRETGAEVEGIAIGDLIKSFTFSWTRSHRLTETKMIRPRDKLILKRRMRLGLVRTNDTLWRRLKSHKQLIQKIKSAVRRIHITTPYFVPPKRIVRALCQAAQRGIEVKILVAGPTDVPLLKWLIPYFYGKLIPSGVKIYEYKKQILHAKTVRIDDWHTIGSSNLNHRSLFHDLEVDLVMQKTTSKKSLAEQFQIDLGRSQLVTRDDVKKLSWARRWIARILLLWKDYM